jgi:hypothetical protein
VEPVVSPVPVSDRSAPAEVAPPEALLTSPLLEAAAAIAADCHLDPAAYLEQVRVTVGGE